MDIQALVVSSSVQPHPLEMSPSQMSGDFEDEERLKKMKNVMESALELVKREKLTWEERDAALIINEVNNSVVFRRLFSGSDPQSGR